MAGLRDAVVLATGMGLLLGFMPGQASASVQQVFSAQSAAEKPGKKKYTHPFIAPTRSGKVVSTPKAGARIKSHLVPVRVSARFTVERAKLNGERIGGSDFVPRGTHRVLVASSSHGLKHGTNTLTVVARHSGTHALKKQTVRFVLPHKKPLTGAGRDVLRSAGTRIELPGRVRLHPSQRTKAAAQAAQKITWSVVKAPGKDPTLRRESPKAISLQADRPGIYRFKAVGSVKGVRTSDTVTGVISAPPMQNFDTEATQDGKVGIRVGDRFFAAPATQGSGQWQVLILDRATSDIVSNTTYGTCPSTQKMCAFTGDGAKPAWIPDDLKALVPEDPTLEQSTRLVIVAGHKGYFPKHDPKDMFAAIGVSKDFPGDVSDGRVHAIVGVPGMAQGQGVNDADGALTGYLLLGADRNFGYASAQRTTFDTRVGDNCDTVTPCAVTMRVGETGTSTVDVPPSGGAVVAVYDSESGATVGTASFQLTGGLRPVNSEIDRLIAYLNGLPEHSLIVLSTAGPLGAARMSPFGYDYGLPADQRDRSKSLADVIEKFGGTGHEFLQSTRSLPDGTSGGDYTLIGWPGAGKGNGREKRGIKARLTGALVRDNLMQYRPANVSEVGGEDSELIQKILYEPQGAKQWPGTGEADYQKALAYINTTFIADTRIGSDLRSAYWTTYSPKDPLSNVTADDWSTWAKLLRLKTDLKAPPGEGFSDKTLLRVRDDLIKEFQWVANTRTYFEAIAAPYETDGKDNELLKSLDNLAANFILSADSARAKVPVEVDWTVIVAALIEVAGALLNVFLPGSGLITAYTEDAIKEIVELSTAVASATTEIVGTSVEAANKHWEQGDTNAEADEDRAYQVKAGALVSEILSGFSEAAQSTNIEGQVIVSDYAKLSDFGQWAGSCISKDLAELADKGTTVQCDQTPIKAVLDLTEPTSESLERTAKARVYQELLPVAYDVLAVPGRGTYGGYGDPEGNWDISRFECRTYHPFTDDKLSTDLTGKPGDKTYGRYTPLFKPFIYRSRESNTLGQGGRNAPTFQAYAIGLVDSSGNWTYPNPNKDLGDTLATSLKIMFAPLPTDPAFTSKGLGMEPAEFIDGLDPQDITKWSKTSCGGWESGSNDVPAPLR